MEWNDWSWFVFKLVLVFDLIVGTAMVVVALIERDTKRMEERKVYNEAYLARNKEELEKGELLRKHKQECDKVDWFIRRHLILSDALVNWDNPNYVENYAATHRAQLIKDADR